MQAVPERQKYVVEEDLVFIRATNNVDSNIRLHLVKHNLVVVEQDIASLLCCLLKEALLEAGLRSLVGIGVLRSAGGSCCIRCPVWSVSREHVTSEKGVQGASIAYRVQRLLLFLVRQRRREEECSTLRISANHHRWRGLLFGTQLSTLLDMARISRDPGSSMVA